MVMVTLLHCFNCMFINILKCMLVQDIPYIMLCLKKCTVHESLIDSFKTHKLLLIELLLKTTKFSTQTVETIKF